MGRCGFSQIGYGFTEQEAKRNAIEDAEAEYGHQEGYSGAMNCATDYTKIKCIQKPKIAKSCKVEKAVQKGARKWETVYVIEDAWGEFRPSKVLANCTQAEAIKQAKKLALEKQREMIVTIDKRLISGKDEVARIKPKKSERGKWLFEGEARC
jgi:hypothetical protein